MPRKPLADATHALNRLAAPRAIGAVAANATTVPIMHGIDIIFGSGYCLDYFKKRACFRQSGDRRSRGQLHPRPLGAPYALIIFTAEALVVGLCYRARKGNIVLYDMAFWLLIGMPLALVFYRYGLSLSGRSSRSLPANKPSTAVSIRLSLASF